MALSKQLTSRIATASVLIIAVLALAYLGSPYTLLGFVAVALVCLWEWWVLTAKAQGRMIRRALWRWIGVAYIVLACAGGAMIFLTAGMMISLWLLVCVWSADSLAYFVGRSVGGVKLAPDISPSKTWSGAVGGLVGAVVASLVFALLGALPFDMMTALMLAPLIAVISILGDLLESAAKRRLAVKDSGNILPGHGGLLDRVDGVLAVWLGAAVLFIF